jgi:hypothetical protein
VEVYRPTYGIIENVCGILENGNLGNVKSNGIVKFILRCLATLVSHCFFRYVYPADDPFFLGIQDKNRYRPVQRLWHSPKPKASDRCLRLGGSVAAQDTSRNSWDPGKQWAIPFCQHRRCYIRPSSMGHSQSWHLRTFDCPGSGETQSSAALSSTTKRRPDHSCRILPVLEQAEDNISARNAIDSVRSGGRPIHPCTIRIAFAKR